MQKEQFAYLARNEDLAFAFPESLYKELAPFLDRLYIKKAGTLLGKIIRNSFVPDHEMAMDGLASVQIPRVSLSREEALSYMQKKNVEVKSEIPNGWFLFTYEGLDIGFAKNIGNRVNNHYPAEWRIRKEPVY